MGKLKQGILGGFSGSVGPVVGSSWKGIDYMKSKPTSVANPKTAKQQAQRGKFGNTVAFAKEMLSSIIKPLRDRFAIQMSGFNSFVKDNIDLFVSALPSPASDLIIASGKMEATSISEIENALDDSEVVINWVNDAGQGYKLADDKAYAVVVNETTGDIVYSAGVNERSMSNLAVSLPTDTVAGDVLNAYLVFMRADGTVVSNTAFRTKTVA